MKLGSAILLALIALAAFQAAYYYPSLPETLASHFDGAGNPDGWSSRTSFIWMSLGITGLVILTFLAVGPCIKLLPHGMINLPNKDYWLAPERRKQSIARIQTQLIWLGNLTLVLLLAVFQLVIEANLRSPPKMTGNIWWIMIPYLLLTLAWAIRFTIYFRKIPEKK